ncbi:MAG: hypothetical protein KDD04_02040 [Sinomicrobium sp.]|nr:hypothetical protein [Sinomicrobium sp.]
MKVHFAGERENCGHHLLRAGVRYRLMSFYEVFNRHQVDQVETLNRFKHVIIDSGLFTLMFGAKAGAVLDEQFLNEWLNAYVSYINATPFKNAHFVEMDIQKKVSPEAAWHYRELMKSRINKGGLINVYHLEDGNPDRLIDYADYIAISIPELRAAISDKERERVTTYIATRAKRKGKKVHLLGCTEIKYLKKYRFCDTCDSTSWQSAFRYGSQRTQSLGNVSINQIRKQTGGKPDPGNEIYWSALFALQDYRKHAGSQD